MGDIGYVFGYLIFFAFNIGILTGVFVSNILRKEERDVE